MAIYEYRCRDDGGFELVTPIGTAPEELCCPACGVEAARVLLAPLVSRFRAALDRAECNSGDSDAAAPRPPPTPAVAIPLHERP